MTAPPTTAALVERLKAHDLDLVDEWFDADDRHAWSDTADALMAEAATALRTLEAENAATSKELLQVRAENAELKEGWIGCNKLLDRAQGRAEAAEANLAAALAERDEARAWCAEWKGRVGTAEEMASEAEERANDLACKLHVERTERARLTERVGELEAALRPFAREHEHFPSLGAGDGYIAEGVGLTFGDLRRARTALAGTETGGGG